MKNKKTDVGLLTWHYYTNVGSNLQAYALFHAIKSLGYSCKFINYRYKKNDSNFIKTILREIFSKINYLIPNTLPERLRAEAYKFQRDYFIQTKRYYKKEQLKQCNRDFSMFLCGSDQIWAPNVFDDAYMFSFVDKNKAKCAYAASIGLDEIPENLQPVYKKYLKDFGYITVREKQGASLLSNLLGKPVQSALDPTFLLDSEQWRELAIYPKQQGYLFCYFLGTNDKHRHWVDQIAKANCLSVICMSDCQESKREGWTYYTHVGPREFLGFICNSKLVITDSFHGIAFSINMQKDFYALERFADGEKNNQNSRIYNILELLNLSDRLLKNTGTQISSIDYNPVRSRLEEQKKLSITFLKNMLQNV